MGEREGEAVVVETEGREKAEDLAGRDWVGWEGMVEVGEMGKSGPLEILWTPPHLRHSTIQEQHHTMPHCCSKPTE